MVQEPALATSPDSAGEAELPGARVVLVVRPGVLLIGLQGGAERGHEVNRNQLGTGHQLSTCIYTYIYIYTPTCVYIYIYIYR